MSSLDEVLQLLQIDDFADSNGYALRMNGKRVFINKWDTGTIFVKEVSQEMLWKIVSLLKNTHGLVSPASIEDFLLIKYVAPYMIRINFPPTSKDYYIDIYKIGSLPSLNARISELWEEKAAYYWLRDFVNELSYA
jgi:hypothetical protein